MEQILWAMKAAPIADAQEWAVLAAMSEAADQDGCNSFLSVETISHRTRLAERTVQRRIHALEERGLIRKGDQSSARKIPADRRPVVYDLQVPYSFFRLDKPYSDGASDLSVNVWRQGRGLAPLTPQDRPELTAPPEKKARKDKGVKRPQSDGVTTSHPEPEPDGVTTSHPRGDYKSPHGVSESHPTLPLNPPQDPQTRGVSAVVVEPPVTREPATPTTQAEETPISPAQKLADAGITPLRDQGRFLEYLHTVKRARDPEAVVMGADPDDLAMQVLRWRKWRRTTGELDTEPVMCEHGYDVAAGLYMCSECAKLPGLAALIDADQVTS